MRGPSRRLGPLGAAAEALAEPLPPVVRRGSASAPPPPPVPGTASFLSSLLDLRGSVALAEAIEDLGEATDAFYDPSRATALRADVVARLADLEDKLARAGAELVLGRASALAPARVVAAIVDVDPDPPSVERAACVAWEPAADYLALRLERVRAAAAELRDEIAPEIAALSPAAAGLERLDAVLSEVTRVGEAKLVARLATAAERRFARAVVRAVEPPGPKDEQLRAAFGKGGGARSAVQAAVIATIAVFQHDRARIEALVEAAARTVSV